MLKHDTRADKRNSDGIYQMQCQDCLLKYIVTRKDIPY
jgi:hypothetical protein